jgi:signal peptide peptidase SppA
MAVKLNPKGHAHARSLIASGKVNKTAPWDMSADDENALLGDNDWAAYSAFHLGVDDSENEDTKAHYKYPFGKGGEVYRSALVAIRQRSAQQGATDIYDAAGALLKDIDGDDEETADARVARVEHMRAPWALMPECIASVVRMGPRSLAERVTLHDRSPAASHVELDDTGHVRAAVRGQQREPGTMIAVLPLYGIIGQRSSWYSDTGLDYFNRAFMDAMRDPDVGCVVIDIDSPGGEVYGVAETAALIAAANKPVFGICNSLCASAAYWIGSQADELYCAPGGEVGSIGVFTTHVDVSAMLAEMGVKVTFISAGKHKVDGNAYEPITDDARAFLQTRVDAYYGDFTRAVAKGRKASVDAVRSGMGQGRVLGADDAKTAGMIDGTATFAQVIGMAQKKLKASAAPARAETSPARSTLETWRDEVEILG